jgi:hypothetical protein
MISFASILGDLEEMRNSNQTLDLHTYNLSAFGTSSQEFEHPFIYIDALDECQENERGPQSTSTLSKRTF